jgi:hypothetical protein
MVQLMQMQVMQQQQQQHRWSAAAGCRASATGAPACSIRPRGRHAGSTSPA